nr:MAG: MC131L [Molluscum contagiosum virus]
MAALVVHPWVDGDPRMQSIVSFAHMVEISWDKPLSVRSCFSRLERKCMRNVIRDYMRSVEPLRAEQNPSGLPLQWLLPEFRQKNPYFLKLMEHRNRIFEKWLQEVSVYYLVDTVGRYALFMVFAILRVEFLNGSVFRNLSADSLREDLVTHLSHAFVELLTYGTYINHAHNCPYMFVGAPMYWAQYVNYFWAYDYLYKYAFMEEDAPFVRMYVAYFEYVRATIRHVGDEVRSVMLTFCGETWAFSSSAPEFIMEALCYSVVDRLRKTDHSVVRLYLEQIPGKDKDQEVYLYHQLESHFHDTINSGVAGTYQVRVPTSEEISAIHIVPGDGIPGEHDWYLPTSKLVTPSLCGLQLVSNQYPLVEPEHAEIRVDMQLVRDKNEPEEEEEDEKGEGVPADEPPRGDQPGNNELPGDEPPYRVPDSRLSGYAQEQLPILNRQIVWLEDAFKKASSCCRDSQDVATRLRHHLETMRQYSVLLSRKTDVQSGFAGNAIWPRAHALDGRWPLGLERPPKTLRVEAASVAPALVLSS